MVIFTLILEILNNWGWWEGNNLENKLKLIENYSCFENYDKKKDFYMNILTDECAKEIIEIAYTRLEDNFIGFKFKRIKLNPINSYSVNQIWRLLKGGGILIQKEELKEIIMFIEKRKMREAKGIYF